MQRDPTLRRPIVVIDGPIAIGKSSLLQALNGLPNFAVFKEPIAEWSQHNTATIQFNPLLEMYNKESYSTINFQLKVMDTFITRYATALTSEPHVVPIFERSTRSATVFMDVRQGGEDGLNEKTASLITSVCRNLYRSMELKHQLLTLVLTANTDSLMTRLNERNIPQENYSREYIERINGQYHQMVTYDPSIQGIDTTHLTATEVYDRAITIINDFINMPNVTQYQLK